MLHVRIGLPLNEFLDLESRRSQGVRDLLGAEEQEIHRYPLSPPFVQMHRLCADVEGQEQQPARTQNPLHLSKGNGDLCPSDMDDRVEGDDAARRTVDDVQREHVALTELDARIQLSSLLYHHGGKVNPGNSHPSLVEVAGYMPWSTPQVANMSTSLNSRSESVE